MDPEKLVGTTGVRVFTATAAAVVVLGVAVYIRTSATGILILTIVSGVLALLGFIHSFEPVYRGWMQFAKRLSEVVVTLLFSLCYLLIVPLFYPIVWLLDVLHLRKRGDEETYWIERSNEVADAESMQRMG